MVSDRLWLGIGFGGQALFAARFFLQWWQSERSRRSVVPVGFWYCSLGGGATLLIYAIHRRDFVFILGQASGLLIYVRNLHLIYQERSAKEGSQDQLNSDGARTLPAGSPPAVKTTI